MDAPRILIVKLTSMGDVLFGLPVVADLKRAYPRGIIDWVVDERFAGLPRSCGLIDHIYALPFRDFRWDTAARGIRQTLQALKAIRRAGYDIAVDLQGMTKSAAIVRLSGAKIRWGYRAADMAEGLLSGVFTHRFDTGRGPHPVIRYRQEIAQVCHNDPSGPPEFGWRHGLGQGITFEASEAKKPHGGHQRASEGESIAVFFPFASKLNKQIPDGFVERIFESLNAKGLRVVIPSGSPHEQRLADRWCDQRGASRWPQQSLEQLIPRLSNAACFIGADTGLTHLCAALGVKTLAVFAKTRPQRYGPHLWSAFGRSLSVHDHDAVDQLSKFMNWVRP